MKAVGLENGALGESPTTVEDAIRRLQRRTELATSTGAAGAFRYEAAGVTPASNGAGPHGLSGPADGFSLNGQYLENPWIGPGICFI